jgi:hypothetical protein
MKENNFFRKALKVAGLATVLSTLPLETNAQNTTKDSTLERKPQTEEIHLDTNNAPTQREFYTDKVKFRKEIERDLIAKITEYTQGLSDTTLSEETKNQIKEAIEQLKRDAEEQIANYDTISKPYIEAFNKYDEQKKWLEKNISSEEYKNRLTKYEKMNPSTQQERLKNLENDYTLDDIDSHYDPKTKETVIERDSKEPKMIHEGTHQSTDAENGMSDYAKKLYQEAYVPAKYKTKQEAFTDAMTPGGYFNNPSELDARKKVLEYDMDRLGIKKYGEKFTEEHYKKLLELSNEGKLSDNSVQFLERIKHEYFAQIMNTIAMNEEEGNPGGNIT